MTNNIPIDEEIIKKEYSTIIDEVTHSLNINKTY